MKFIPAPEYVEVEPITAESLISNDEKKWVEAAKVVSDGEYSVTSTSSALFYPLKKGDIVFFRPHGFFETEYEGKKHCVLRLHEDYILGKISHEE